MAEIRLSTGYPFLYHLSEKKSTVRKQNDYEARIDEFFGQNGHLSTVLPGFEFREGQLMMARAVGQAFAGGAP